MIAHINIMLQLVALLTGVWIIFYIIQIHKTYGYPILKRLVWVSVFMNLWLLLSLTSKYININVAYFYSSTKISWGYLIRHPLSTIIFSGAVLTLIPVVIELFGYYITTLIIKICRGVWVIIVLGYITGFIFYANNPNSTLLEYVDIVIFGGGNALVYVSLLFLIFFNRQKEMKLRGVRIFALIYSIVFLPIAAFMFMLPLKLTLISALFILSNFIPFVWLKYFFTKYFVESQKFKNADSLIAQIAEQHSISQRECEIMKLILQGNSNKEIESALFISLNTVRNHTHNLYKKLGVNGRGQLVNLVLSQNNFSNETSPGE